MRYQTPTTPKRPSFSTASHRLPHASLNSESLRCRRWRWALGHAPRVAAPLLQPLARAHVEVAVELGSGLLAMDKVTETAAHATLARVEAAARLAEICNRRQFTVDGAAGVPARVECVARLLRVFFVLEAHVDVANEI